MEKVWVYKSLDDNAPVESLSKELNISDPLGKLLVQRDIITFDAAKEYFRPSIKALHDPFAMKDMDRAVNRLSDAIANDEKILIYGDYDVDGTTSVAMVFQFLSHYTSNIIYYVPDRYVEGYGISKQGIEWAAAQDVSLCIALDCGIKAFENASLAKSLGIDLIICDHHLPGDNLPEAYAILDPKRKDCDYPFKELSGCGVGFKLLTGFCIQNTIDLKTLFQYLDLVAVSIASDIVPIIGENRILAYYGIKKLNSDPIPGLKALIEISGLSGKLDVSNIVFYIGPRINATGRLTHARESVKLLVGKKNEDLKVFTERLDNANIERKAYDESITNEALEMLEEDENYKHAKSTVLYKEDWHKGVIGIVASRCTDHYYRPTIILTRSNGKATGSARSVNGFDIYEAIDNCADLLDQYGGHAHAAGLTISLDNLEKFKDKFEAVVASTITEDQLLPKLEIDLNIDFSFINFKNLSVISQMAPFGPRNMQPLFCSEDVYLKTAPQTVKEEHLRLSLYQKEDNKEFPAIAFGMGDLKDKLSTDKPIKVAYYIEENNYQGNKSLQLIIKDIKFSD